ncbi:MAG TPA: exodeoxyribonuclease VII small subunit [Anaerolineae bacterium]|nr:exodeoxyribonuclease VII small subunit [Anaerolineae bacterium]
MDSTSNDIDQLTFEEAYLRLQETVTQLEAGNLPLAKAMTLYQTGMDLAKQCGLQLDQAELTIKKLTPSGDLVDFDEI